MLGRFSITFYLLPEKWNARGGVCVSHWRGKLSRLWKNRHLERHEVTVLKTLCCQKGNLPFRAWNYLHRKPPPIQFISCHPVYRLRDFLFYPFNVKSKRIIFIWNGWDSDIDSFGHRKMNWWSSNQSNMINGTDGAVFHPLINRNELLYIFAADLCR